MRQSSGSFEVLPEGCSGLEDGPEHVDAASGEGDDGLMVSLSFAPFSVVEGAAVAVAERAEGGLLEDTLEALVAACRAFEESGLARLAEHRRHAGGQGECVGGTEAGEVACLGDEFCGEDGPHSGQAADEGRVRVALEPRFQFAIELDEPSYDTEWFVSDRVLAADDTLVFIVCYSGWSVEPCLFYDRMKSLNGAKNLVVLTGGGKIA